MSSFVRAADISLRPMPSGEYLNMLFKYSKTEDTGARICAHFESELLESNPSVGVLGLYCCEELVGGVNYGLIESAYHKHFYAGRLDTVVTLPAFRGMGLGAAMMSGLMVYSYEALGDGLKHFSTVVLHPAVRAFVGHIGFERAPGATDNRFALDFPDHQTRDDFYRQAKRLYSNSMHKLKSKCVSCISHSWPTPWCRPERKAKASA